MIPNVSKHNYSNSILCSPSALPSLSKSKRSQIYKSQSHDFNLPFPQSVKASNETRHRQKNFLEIMGYVSRDPVSSLHSPLSIVKVSSKISVTDLMGSKKYSFLKKTGFLPMYYECKKTEEFKKLVEEKNTLSYANIVHTDIMRENSLKKTKLAKNSAEYRKYKKRKGTKKVTKIEEIYKKCDKLYEDNKLAKQDIKQRLSVLPEEVHRNLKRKLTNKEINEILINIQQIE